MRIRVAFLPAQLAGLNGDVCIVVDVIRASTAIVGLFEAGCERVFVSASTADAARARAVGGATSILCAEQDDGSAPNGYDYEPSPALLSSLPLKGRPAVLATANGTPAILQSHREGAAAVLIGSLRNLDAVAALALEMAASRGVGVTTICSGQLRNSRVAIEDVLCAGAISDRICRLAGSNGTTLDDDAIIARSLALSCDDVRGVLRQSMTGQRFISGGKTRDVDFCAETNISTLVPVLVTRESDAPSPVHILDG